MTDYDHIEKIISQLESLQFKPEFICLPEQDAISLGYTEYKQIGNGWVQVTVKQENNE